MSENTKAALGVIGAVILFVLLAPWGVKWALTYSDWVMR